MVGMKEHKLEPGSPKFRRVLKLPAILIIVAAGLYAVRLGLGPAAAAIHFRNTPAFAEYIASHPVKKEVIEQRIPPGEAIDEPAWIAGTVDPLGLTPNEGDHMQAGQRIQVDITHGGESLLRFRQDFDFAFLRKDWTRHGVRIGAPLIITKPGFRAVTVTTIKEPGEMIGENSMGVGSAIVDVFLVSGGGPSEARIQFFPDDYYEWGLALVNSSAYRKKLQAEEPPSRWRRITGNTHNVEPLPAEGLIHHVRRYVNFDWEKTDTGFSGPGDSPHLLHTANTSEYSHEIKIQHEASMEGKTYQNSTRPKSLNHSWKGEVW